MKATGALYEVDRSPAIPVGAAVGWAGAVAVLYFLAARLGLALLAQPSDVAVFWPASGVAAGILILSGRRAYPALIIGVVIGTVAANLMSDRGVWTSMLNGFCNAGEAVLMAWLLERWFGRTFTFGDVHRVVGFFAAAGIAAATSAVGGATTMTLFHGAGPFWDVWRAWFLSDGIGIAVVAPLAIGLGPMWREPPSRGEVIEGVGGLVLLALTSIYVVTQSTGSWLSFSPVAAVLPLLLWLAARSQPTFAIAGSFFASAAVICATSFGMGRFGDAAIPLFERAKGAQSAVMTVTAYTLFLVALFAAARQGEKALKQSMKRLRLALDGAELGAFSADFATGHFECDLRTARMHGHNVPPTTIKESRRFVHRNDLAHIDAALAKARDTGRVWNAEYRVMHPPNQPHAGETRWVAVEASIVLDARGMPKGLLGVTRDITSRKLAEQALAESNLQLALAGKAGLVGSFAYDIETEEVQASPGYASIHGFPEGTTHITRGQWLNGVHPEDRGRMDELWRRVFRDQRGEYGTEYRIVRSGAEVRWIEARCFVSYRGDGSPLRVVGVNIDVTERKQAEDRQRVLVAELDHRVKNVLAIVNAVAARTLDTSASMDQFVAALSGRIRSMATTHELLSGRLWKGIPLAELLGHQLAPYATSSNMDVEGPDVFLSAGASQTLGIVFHELIANAAKYGALSTHDGRISVRWHWPPNGKAPDRLAIEWQEIGGPAVQAPSRSGHGMEVIRDLVPYELDGTVELAFASEGVRCRVDIPMSQLTSVYRLGGEFNGSDSAQNQFMIAHRNKPNVRGG